MASVVTRAGQLVIEDASRSIEERVGQTVAEHYEFVWRSLRRLGVLEASADDAAQQVFCVYAKRVRDVLPGKDKTFLFGVVLRVAQSVRREHQRRAEVNDDDAMAAISTTEAGPDERLDEERARAVLDAVLAELPIDLRAVFVLYEIEELTMAEIATMLELPPGTVASRLRRARACFEERVASLREGSSR